MSDNKFLLRLKGQQTPKSVVEIKNDKLVAPFVDVPKSTNVVGSIIDDKDSSVVVAKGAQNWQIDGSALTPATTLYGDGKDFLSEYVAANSLWVNASYTFPQTGNPKHPVAEIFNAQTKWVLQLCGKNLLSKTQSTIPFTFVVQIGTATIATKTVRVAEQAGYFRKLFVVDFSESTQKVIEAQGGAKLTVQLLCGDSSASATIYNGMTVLTALQRRVDASVVSGVQANVEEVLQDIANYGDIVTHDASEFVEKTGDTMTGDLNVPNINFTNKGELTYQVGTSKINLIGADGNNTLGKINVGQGNVQTNVNSATFTQTLAGIQYKILNNNDAVTSVSNTNKIITQADLPTVDSELSTSSENPVQNKVVTAAISTKADNSNVVHIANTETIDGIKTFSSAVTVLSNTPAVNIVNSNDTLATTPSNQQIGQIFFQDNARAWAAVIQRIHTTSGENLLAIRARRQDASISNAIIIGYDNHGEIYTSAPASDSTNSIVTTTAIAKSANGYIKLGNGIIIQWGTVAAGTQTTTLPTAFSTTNFTVVGATYGTDSNYFTVPGQTTTTITTHNVSASHWLAIGY